MPQILEENRVIMRVHAGSATYQDEEIKLATSLHGAPVISFENGTTIYWTWEELIAEALKLKKEVIVHESRRTIPSLK